MINDDWPSIDPGRFRNQVSLLAKNNKTSGSGIVISYEPIDPPVTAQVDIQFVRGDELIKGGVDVSQSFLKMTGWYRAEFSAGNRIRTSDGQEFTIQYRENVRFMGIYMVLTCLSIGGNCS